MRVFFVVLFAAAIVFIGYRIVTKPAYVRHETRQCRLLALSAAEIAADVTQAAPTMWDRFGSEGILIEIDHMKMVGNYVVRVTATSEGSKVRLFVTADSGWNTRSLQHSEQSIVIDKKAAPKTGAADADITKIRGLRAKTVIKYLTIEKTMSGQAPSPVIIKVIAVPYDKDYFVLKLNSPDSLLR